MQFFLLISCIVSAIKLADVIHYSYLTKLLFEYQCTSGKYIRLPNRIEKIDSVARIESNQNCPNWNALVYVYCCQCNHLLDPNF